MASTATALSEFPRRESVRLHLDPVVELDDAQLFELCRRNRELRIERTPGGELIAMSPAGSETSARTAAILLQLSLWAREDGTGVVFDSSGGFLLPGGALRSPDAAWVEKQRLSGLSADQRRRFAALCPTFVIELLSPSDSFAELEGKMAEYLAAGAVLGWLMDPEERSVWIYRPGEVEFVESPRTLSGEKVLPGFVLELEAVWDPFR